MRRILLAAFLLLCASAAGATAFDGELDIRLNEFSLTIGWGLDYNGQAARDLSYYYDVIEFVSRNRDLLAVMKLDILFSISERGGRYRLSCYRDGEAASSLEASRESELKEGMYRTLGRLLHIIDEKTGSVALYALSVPLETGSSTEQQRTRIRFGAQLQFMSASAQENDQGLMIAYFFRREDALVLAKEAGLDSSARIEERIFTEETIDGLYGESGGR